MWNVLSLALLLLSLQAPTGAITGRILNPDGTPAAGIRVGATDSTAPAASNNAGLLSFTITSGDGRYRLDGLAPGRYYVFAGPLDLPTYHPGTIERAGAKIVTVAAGTPVTAVDFTLAQATLGFKVRGRIADNRMTAVPRTVQIQPLRDETGSHMSRAAEPDGTFELSGVLPGNYLVSVGTQPRMIAVRDRDLEGVDLVVPHMIKVEGIVKDENGRALPKLELTFAPKDFTLPLGSLSASEIRGFLVGGIPAVLSNPDPLGGLTRNPRFIPLETAPDGVFGAGILGLAEGAYRFAFRQLPPGYRIKSVTDGSTDLRTGWLTLTADRDSVRITAVLERVAPVRASGRVVGADSAQVSTIVFTANAVSIGEEVNVKPGGTFEFPALAPGSYIATLVLDSGLRVPAGAVTVGGNGTTGIEIIVPPMRNIVGRVTVEENGPPQTFNLLLAPDLPQELKNPAFLKLFLEQAQVFTNVPLSNADDWIGLSISPLPDGTFHFAVPEGLYQVVFVDPVFFTRGTKLRLKNTLRSLTYGSANLETEPMRVSRADSAELRVVLTPTLKSFQVSGRVSGLSPDRQREARVRLEGDMFTSLEVPVTSDGSFTFDKVAQGAYRARVFPELPTAPPVQVVVVDRDVTNLEIALPLLREIHGRMAVEGQGPPVGLGLQLIPSTDPAQPPVSVLVNPEPDGTFRFMAPDGEFWVLAFELPLGHQVQVQSLQWGATDLSRETLKISASTTSRLELRIGVRVTPRVTPDAPFAIPVPTVTISGRVTGGGVAADSRITLTGCGGTFETRIVDGAFEFSRIPQGVYMATVVRNGERFPVTSLVPVGSENRDSLFWVARQTPLGTDRPVSETVNATGAEVMNSPLTDLFFSRCR